MTRIRFFALLPVVLFLAALSATLFMWATLLTAPLAILFLAVAVIRGHDFWQIRNPYKKETP